jgi:uncharacterized repeat protein (TIGR01451 family)
MHTSPLRISSADERQTIPGTIDGEPLPPHTRGVRAIGRLVRLVAAAGLAAGVAGTMGHLAPLLHAQTPPTLPGDIFPTCPINQMPPPTNFTIQQRWTTPDVAGQRTLTYQTPVVGDLYGNGRPVVVVGADNAYNIISGVPTRVAKDLRIVDGLDGTILRTITTPLFSWSGQAAAALADVDGDGQGEIILKASHVGGVPLAQRGRLIAYRNDGTELWTSDQRYDYSDPNGRAGASLGFADFNADGVPEVYVGTEIFNARTGARLVSATSAASAGCPYRGSFGCFWSQPTAVDMDGDGRLELVAGNVVYKVNITNTTGEAGNGLTVWQQATAAAGVGDGWTAVADIDLDGDPDVVVVRTTSASQPGPTVLYVWDGQTGAIMGALPSGIGNAGGPPLIGDIDGDGRPEIVFQNISALRAFDFTPGTGLTPKWTLATNDASGTTSLSMFDFNSDGVQELVYRDQTDLRIIDGTNSPAVNRATFACRSGTAVEMPVIAALDSTREARILVTCGESVDPLARGTLRAFETASFPWASTRPVWNQQAYFVTHVSNDLSIPAPQFPHWTSFNDPANVCSDGTNRPLNAFQQQVTDLDQNTGCAVSCPVPARVTVQKTATPANVLIPGGTVTYTVVVTNNGPGDSPNTVVQDPFPDGIVSATWTCAASGGAVCPNASGGPVLPPGNMLNETVATFPANSSLTYTIAATVSPTPPAFITNTASADSPTMLCDPNDARPPCRGSAIVPQPVVELVITKTSSPKPAIPGDTLTYLIAVTNNGPDTATDARVLDAVPAALSAFTWTCTQPSGSCSPVSGTGTIDTLVDLAPGAAATITLTGTLDAGHSGTITNVATVTEPPGYQVTCPVGNPNCRTATDINDPVPSSDLSMAKTPPANILRGGAATYILTVTNRGPSTASGVTIADPTPPGLELVEAGAPCTGGFPCTVGTLASGGSVSVPVTMRVPATYAGPIPIANTACVSSATADPNTADNCQTVTTPLVEVADIQVSKTVDRDTPAVGEEVTFTITAQNLGPSNATGVALTDALPVGLVFVSATPSQGTYDEPSGLWTVGALLNGASATLQLRVRVEAEGAQVNTVAKTAGDQVDPVVSNNSAAAGINAGRLADVQVTKTVNVTVASVGSPVTYTVTARNAGPSTATQIQIREDLPSGLTFVSATPSAGTFDPSTRIWALDSLALQATATLTIVATVDEAGVHTNVARKVGQGEGDPNPTNDESGVTVDGQSADVQVVKTVSAPPIVTVGQEVTFFVTASNNGPGAATGVRVSEKLPAGLAFISATASKGAYVSQTGVWEIGDFDFAGAGATALLEIHAVVTSVTAPIVNTARVSRSDEPDPIPSNNESTVTLPGAVLDLAVGITTTDEPNRVGSTATFTVSATNVSGVTSVEPITIAVPLPPEYTFIPTPTPGWECSLVGRTVFCRTTATLTPGQLITVPVRVEVTADLTWGRGLFAHLTTRPDTNPQNDTAQVYIGPPPHPDPDMATTQSVVISGTGSTRTLTYTIDVANQGPIAGEDIVLTDVLPHGTTLVSARVPSGPCNVSGSFISCNVGPMLPGHHVDATIVITATAPGVVIHTVTASSEAHDMYPRDNQSVLATTLESSAEMDTDADGMPDVWESLMGLSVVNGDANADPDGDGVSNLKEYRRGTHPRGFYKQYFAEGVSSDFFTTAFVALNLSATQSAGVLFEYMIENGQIMSDALQVDALSRATRDPYVFLGAVNHTYAAVIESDQPIAADRTVSWGSPSYGAHAETGLPAPASTWYFAEGATGPFQLFYLLQNPNATDAHVDVNFLLTSGAPIVQSVTVPPSSRVTLHVNEVPGLDTGTMSTQITADQPIVAERAMYFGLSFLGGTDGAGASALSTDWFFAEGATGAFFETFILIANPGLVAADLSAVFARPDGQTVTRTYTVAPQSRFTIQLSAVDPLTAATTAAVTLTSTNGVPVVAERAMYWPRAGWQEGSASLGSTTTGLTWAVPSGTVGGPQGARTYVLVSNASTTAGSVLVTLVRDNGPRVSRTIDLPAQARQTIDVDALFPEAADQSFSVIVDSTGPTPVPIVVESARYWSTPTVFWAAGTSELASKVR